MSSKTKPTRTVFFISDGTGITAETLGYSLITQFEEVDFKFATLPYVNTEEKAKEAAMRINNVYQEEKKPPLIFATLVNTQLCRILAESKGLFMDFFSTFIGPIEAELHTKSSHRIGKKHAVHNSNSYNSRIDAINFTLSTDDGINVHQYEQADIILVGVSRSGKTPTSLYLSLQFGIRCANYPITEEDMSLRDLPAALQKFTHKLFGLTIDPLRLQAIRKERRPSSRYASLQQCNQELSMVEKMLKRNSVAVLNTTNLSIEEISTRILAELGIERRLL